jgi:hypothetical protein
MLATRSHVKAVNPLIVAGLNLSEGCSASITTAAPVIVLTAHAGRPDGPGASQDAKNVGKTRCKRQERLPASGLLFPRGRIGKEFTGLNNHAGRP